MEVEHFFLRSLGIFSDTTRDSLEGDYGIDDVRSDQDSDNEEEDETRIPGWAKGSFSHTIPTSNHLEFFFFRAFVSNLLEDARSLVFISSNA